MHSVGFSNSWWNKEYGIAFDESFFNNPVNRLEKYAFMRKTLLERFPLIGKDFFNKYLGINEAYVNPYGDRFIPAVFGCGVSYQKDQAPWCIHNKLSVEQIKNMPYMTMNQFSDNSYVKNIIEQAKIVKRITGSAMSMQNSGSPINTAIYLRGIDLFTDYIYNPKAVHKLYSLITNVMILAYDYFSEVDGIKRMVDVGNCSVAMISPKQYEDFNQKYDLIMMEKARREKVAFHMHQDSDVTKYINSYKALKYLHVFDIGCDTDMLLFRKNFPGIILNIFIYNSFLFERTPEQIYEDISKMKKDAGPQEKVEFTSVDVDESISDEKFIALCEAIKA